MSKARFTVSKDELQARKDAATLKYSGGEKPSYMDDGSTAILAFQFDRVQDAFPAFAKKVADGWTIPLGMEFTYVNVIPPIPGHTVNTFVSLQLQKPQAQREEELKVIHKAVEAAYKDELQVAREQEVNRVVEQRLASERRAALADAEAQQQLKEKADRERIHAEVSAAISGGK